MNTLSWPFKLVAKIVSHLGLPARRKLDAL
jgi:hypothetical protein